MRNKKKSVFIIVFVLLVIIALVCLFIFLFSGNKDSQNKNIHTNSVYRISGNNLESFDFYFLQLENERENKVYSPLSIKYALGMLAEGADEETKEQIISVIGDYAAKKYINSSNMSFANGLFVKDSYKSTVKATYADLLSSKYNADVIYDSFDSANTLNSWVSDKTFNLVNNVYDDISDFEFILVNALAIDMEWVQQIQNPTRSYYVGFDHEEYGKYVSSLSSDGYHRLEFDDDKTDVEAVEIGAVVNKYDIVNELGEENIRKTVTDAYNEWIIENPYDKIDDFDAYLDQYLEDIDENYGHVSSSTDFYFYTDDNVKVFAKDLKEYNGTTLQYVGIMPTNESLDSYIKNIKVSDVHTLINSLKSISLDNFKDGVITEISGYVPMFHFDYELDLMADLKELGITDVFDSNKANLSNLTTEQAYINDAKHKATIEFSNDGIKAAAVTIAGGEGGASGGFEYLYEVPVEHIDLTFDSPYLFLIRDVDTGEVWFTGTVYEPTEYVPYY